jgi:hypothetical protein
MSLFLTSLHARRRQTRKRSLHGGGDRFHYCHILIVFNDLRGDRELVILLMGQPEPTPNLREDVLDHFSVPQLIEDDDLVVSELIAIGVVCHSVSPFLIDALRISPETKKAQPELTDWAWLWFVAVK